MGPHQDGVQRIDLLQGDRCQALPFQTRHLLGTVHQRPEADKGSPTVSQQLLGPGHGPPHAEAEAGAGGHDDLKPPRHPAP